ncbi:asparagine synthase-related protein [Desulfogranum japonicum]|uniref:asparagine synthase-related protein n=1 Tax=Desulfogranum japonicum TaxID=231447 RepID=UPI00041115D3|nr:asparagine synthase-related protein [Desulfogranum japonicum]
MSTIAGIVYNEQHPGAGQRVHAMLSAMSERAGALPQVQTLGRACLGFSLFVTDTGQTVEKTPLVCQSKQFLLTGDVRLDNRTELAHDLNLNPADYSDNGLLLHAWKHWGTDTPRHLTGDYAFALWDTSQQRLFCVRDRLGIRPLFYCHTPQFFAFASEIKALQVLVDSAIDEHTLAAYILRLVPNPAHTFFQDIHRLLPATIKQVHGQKTTTHTYWSPHEVAPINCGNTEQYAQMFRELFAQAVHCRLQSSGVVGSTLSGGLDSSSIVCTAAPLLNKAGRELFTYSAVFSGLEGEDAFRVDETVYRQAVLDQVLVQPRIVDVSQADIYQQLDQELSWLDAPFFNPNLYIHRALYQQARNDGVQVFLDGIDGDTVVSHGYELLPQLFLKPGWIRLHRELQHMKHLSGSRQPLWRLAAAYAVKPVLQWLLDSPILRTVITLPTCKASFSEEFAKRNPLAPLIYESSSQTHTDVGNARNHHKATLALPHLMFALETSNQVASRYDMEERYPFLDTRLVEFCLALPPEQKFHNGWSRAILRKAMASTLPPKICQRLTKANLSPVFMQQTRTAGREILAQHCDSANPLLSQYLAPAFTHKLLSHQKPESSLQLYATVCLLKWLEKHVV